MNWVQWYTSLGVQCTGEPNDSGWVKCKCLFHDSQEEKAAVNVLSGNYKCWIPTCRSRYRGLVGTYPESEILTPREFLVVTGHSATDALSIVTDVYSNVKSEDKVEPVPKSSWIKYVHDCQKALNENLDIVREYCTIKGLKYSTLKRFNVGYDAAKNSLVFPYYSKSTIVGLKLRNVLGQKYNASGSTQFLFNITEALKSNSSTVIIVEGESDCLRLTQELNDSGIDIPVISTPGNNFKLEWGRNLQGFTRVLCIPQADEASAALAASIKKAVHSRLQVIILPWEPLSWGKDVVDYLWQHTTDKLLDLLGADISLKQRISSVDTILKDEDTEIDYVIPHIIERGTKTLLLGEPKVYKTWIALQMMDSVVNCTPLLGMRQWTPKTFGTALLVEEEGSSQRLKLRLRSVFKGGGSKNAHILHRQMVKLDDEFSVSKLIDDILQVKPDLLIFDPYVNIHSQDENSASGTQLVMDALNRLLSVWPNMAIVLIHHTSKEKTSPRGSTVLWGAMDEQIYVSRAKAPNSIELQLRGRDIPEGAENNILFIFEKGRHRPFNVELQKPKTEPEPEPKPAEESTMPASKLLPTMEQLKKYIRKVPKPKYTKTELTNALIATVSYNTASAAIYELVKTGFLVETGMGKRGHPFEYTVVKE